MHSISSKSQSIASPIEDAQTPLFSTFYKVYINHTDAGGIVYHANHLVFFENCRRDWFSTLDLNGYFLQTSEGHVQHFVVSQVELYYKKPILLDERIKVSIDSIDLKPASIIFYQSIYRHHSKNPTTDDSIAADELLSRTKIIVACVQNQITPQIVSTIDSRSNDTIAPINPMRPVRLPEALHLTLQQALTTHNESDRKSAIR